VHGHRPGYGDPVTFEIPMNGLDRLVVRLVYAQRAPLLGRAARWLLRWRGTDIDPAAVIGAGLRIRHCGTGIVVHPSTRIGTGVTFFHNVTIGRARIWEPPPAGSPGGVRVGDGAVLCAGAVILFNDRDLTIGAGTVIGANAVLTSSTGPGEIWAGSPARKVADRAAAGPAPAAR
jgi:serine O-acetyltransferase